MSELKNCPFCGGEAKQSRNGIKYLTFCKCCFNMSHSFNTEQEAITNWNRRKDRWIPVSERLPEKKDTTQGCWLLVNWKEGNEVAPMLLRDVIECAEEGLLTHWMPLPAPPEGVK